MSNYLNPDGTLSEEGMERAKKLVHRVAITLTVEEIHEIADLIPAAIATIERERTQKEGNVKAHEHQLDAADIDKLIEERANYIAMAMEAEGKTLKLAKEVDRLREALNGGHGAQPGAMAANLEFYAHICEGHLDTTGTTCSVEVITNTLRQYAFIARAALAASGGETKTKPPCPRCRELQSALEECMAFIRLSPAATWAHLHHIVEALDVTCSHCGHSLQNNSHGFDQNDFGTNTCTYCKFCQTVSCDSVYEGCEKPKEELK